MLNITRSIEGVDCFGKITKVFYTVDTLKVCLECCESLDTKYCICGCGLEPMDVSYIMFRKLINSQWHSYKVKMPEDLETYLKITNNIVKLDDYFWMMIK